MRVFVFVEISFDLFYFIAEQFYVNWVLKFIVCTGNYKLEGIRSNKKYIFCVKRIGSSCVHDLAKKYPLDYVIGLIVDDGLDKAIIKHT